MRRERESVLEMRRVRWNYVDVGILMCHCLEEVKNFLFASGFNLYTR